MEQEKESSVDKPSALGGAVLNQQPVDYSQDFGSNDEVSNLGEEASRHSASGQKQREVTMGGEDALVSQERNEESPYKDYQQHQQYSHDNSNQKPQSTIQEENSTLTHAQEQLVLRNSTLLQNDESTPGNCGPIEEAEPFDNKLPLNIQIPQKPTSSQSQKPTAQEYHSQPMSQPATTPFSQQQKKRNTQKSGTAHGPRTLAKGKKLAPYGQQVPPKSQGGIPNPENFEMTEEQLKQFQQQDQDPNAAAQEEMVNLKEIFDLFDKEKEGMISVLDLKQIYMTLRSNKNQNRFYEILKPITDSDHLEQDQLDIAKVPFDVFLEFVNQMAQLDRDLPPSQPSQPPTHHPSTAISKSSRRRKKTPLTNLSSNPAANDGQIDNVGSKSAIMEQDQESIDKKGFMTTGKLKVGSKYDPIQERKKYGCVLPRTGVYFLPDNKVIDFLKLLNDYKKQCETEQRFEEANKAKTKFDELREKEQLRQLNNMRQAQEQELMTVENAQRSQFREFSKAWDNYMADYEATAYLSLEKLKEKHVMELDSLQKNIRGGFSQKFKQSKSLVDMRKQQKVFQLTKSYMEAESIKQRADQQEMFERQQLEQEVENEVMRKEERLRDQQQLALGALLKRIQRDRNEQLKHRQQDSQRLIQRNRNLIADMIQKQNMETKRTKDYLSFALGVRSPNRNKNLFKSKYYIPLNQSQIATDRTGGREVDGWGSSRGQSYGRSGSLRAGTLYAQPGLPPTNMTRLAKTNCEIKSYMSQQNALSQSQEYSNQRYPLAIQNRKAMIAQLNSSQAFTKRVYSPNTKTQKRAASQERGNNRFKQRQSMAMQKLGELNRSGTFSMDEKKEALNSQERKRSKMGETNQDIMLPDINDSQK